MKFNIAKGQLLTALNTASRGMSSRSTLPFLSGIYMSSTNDGKISIQATDLEKATNVLTVPESALEFVKEESYVYKKGQDGTYTMTKVQTGLSDGVNIEIKEGLSEGDTVRGPRIIEDETTQETTETTETAEQEESTDNAE